METRNEDLFEQQSTTFMHWLVESGKAEINPKVTLKDLRCIGAGRGVVALSALGDDELVFRIPRDSTLTVDTSELSSLLPQGVLASLDPWLAFILVLIFETRLGSPWKPYIDLLPTEFNSLMFWTPEELSALRGSTVLGKIGKEEAEGAFTNRLLPVVQNNEDVFRDTILAAIPAGSSFGAHFLRVAHRMASIIMSHSFDLVVPGQETNDEDSDDDEGEEKEHYKAMVPLADMLNADGDRNNCRLSETPSGLEMKTICAIPTGSELFNDYGPLPRSDLLRRYGYTTENYAAYDVVEIGAPLVVDAASTALSADDKKARIDYLLDEGVLDDAFDIDAATLEVPEEALAVVNTLLLPPSEFARYRAAGKTPKPKATEAVVEVLTAVLEARMREYPTTVEEDQRILAEGLVRGRERTAVEVRLGEKQILVGAYKELSRRLQDKKRATDGGNRNAKRVKT